MLWNVCFYVNGQLHLESFIGPEAERLAHEFGDMVNAFSVWGG